MAPMMQVDITINERKARRLVDTYAIHYFVSKTKPDKSWVRAQARRG